MKRYTLPIALVVLSLALIIVIVIYNRTKFNQWSDVKWFISGIPWKSGASLGELEINVSDNTTKALLIIKDNKIVYEKYSPGSNPNKLFSTASLSKSLAGSMSLLIALNDSLLQLDEPAWKYIKQWKHDPQKSKITLRHLASHSSGMPHKRTGSDKQMAWQQAFLQRKPGLFSLILSDTPIGCIPGSCYQYSGPAFAALAYAVTTRLKSTKQSDILTLLDKRLMQPLGIPDADWLIGYGESYRVDDMTLYATWGGALFTARATARIGQLMLHEGIWQDKEIIKPSNVKKVITYANTPAPESSTASPLPTAGWWSNANDALPSLPKDAYLGAGAGHQLLLIIPSLNTIIVRFGRKLGNDAWGGDYWTKLDSKLLKPLMQAVSQHTTTP